MTTSIREKSAYHHGDLRASLLSTAKDIVNKQGIEQLSLRKMAEKVGVSRTAAYHHFKDKNELLCAIAADGFEQWQAQSVNIFSDTTQSNKEKFHLFVYSYIRFAMDNANLYDLMFGRTLWKKEAANDTLKKIAYQSFEHQVKMTQLWQQQNILNKNENALRLAQVVWGTLHGIAKLQIDGIYTESTNIDEMCHCAVTLFLSLESSSKHC